jgi:TPR repeat protein/type IV secretory pathway TraG/TraD family ATPase VirD4
LPHDDVTDHRTGARSRSAPLGTAQWMSEAEALQKFAFDDQLFEQNDDGLWEGRANGQIWLGETFDGGPVPIGYRDDRHVLLVSGTRGGKGTSVIIPNLCLWPGSSIVIDPKGENATVTARRRGDGSLFAYGLKQSVRILDPFGEVQLSTSLKARYNPLDAIDPKSDFAVDDAGRIAAAIVVIENQHDPFWEQAARNLIKALILHVLTASAFEGRRNLVTVWRLLRQGDWQTVERARAAGQEKIPSGFTLLWHGMRRNAAYNGLIAGEAEQMIDMHERTRSGILKVATTATEFIDGPPMQRLLETSDFDLAALKTDPAGLTIYLTLPQRYMTTHYRWLRLMISLAVGEMERIKGRPATGYPTLFVLDEFAGLKRMEAVENAAAQAAGFGVKFLFVLQNLAQLKEIYDDSWETFIGNSGLRLFFQIDDNFTRTYLAQQIGEGEVLRQTQSGSQSRSSSTSTTHGDSSSFTDGTTNSFTDGRTTGFSSSVTDGVNYGQSRTTGRGRSGGMSFNFGGGASSQSGGNFSRSRTSSSGWSRSRSSSTSQSRSRSRSFGTSRSRTSSMSSSRSESESTSTTDGWSEAVHKRLLINPDEIGRFLARIDNKDHPAYPGLLLALTPGEQPLPLHRVNYFQSPWFGGLFDPHPDHDPPPSLAERMRRLADLRKPSERSPELATVIPFPKPLRRRRGLVYAAIAVAVVLVAAILWSIGSPDTDRQQAAAPPPAVQPRQPSQSADIAGLLKNGDESYARKDFADSLRWYRLAADPEGADPGDARAQVRVANQYLNGKGVARDPAEALRWFRKAADQGNLDAEARIGVFYMEGTVVAQDYAQALSRLRQTAEQGNATGQTGLGLMYARGTGVPTDYSLALQLFQKATAQNYPQAQNAIGIMYMNGLGVERDYSQAFHWLSEAAAQELPDAQRNLGLLYEQGLGVKRDDRQAMDWYRKAADQGDAEAQTDLGEMFATGEGVERDIAEALRLFRKAAEQGNSHAEYDLGIAYSSGEGVPRNMAKARELIQKAAAAGSELAATWLLNSR